jgi:hypothetical protein
MKKVFWFFVLVFCFGMVSAVLEVHPENPRYFIDDGKAVRLSGHQMFFFLQDGHSCKPDPWKGELSLDFEDYIDFAKENGINYIRLWTESTGGCLNRWSLENEKYVDIYIEPSIYERTGPGYAADGKLKFNIDSFNQDFFDKMKQRIARAEEEGIYVSIMFFDPYTLSKSRQPYNTFTGGNNINGIAVEVGNSEPTCNMNFIYDSRYLDIHHKWIEKVIDTVNEFDNVFYEIANEINNPTWQYGLIDYIKNYEKGKQKQHLVYMSPGGRTNNCAWSLFNKNTLYNSDADVVALAKEMIGGTTENPSIESVGVPVFWDNDHIWPNGKESYDFVNYKYVWISFTRGFHYSFYDEPFLHYYAIENGIMPETSPAKVLPTGITMEDFDIHRKNIGATNYYFNKFRDVSSINPTKNCDTGYCLVGSDEMLVYQPNSGSFVVNLNGEYYYEWYNPSLSVVFDSGYVTISGSKSFSAPFSGDSVLFLQKKEVNVLEMVLRYTLDSGSVVGSQVIDSSGKNNHGIKTGGVEVLGKIKEALRFDGNDYIDVADDGSLIGLDGAKGTFAAWFKSEDPVNSAYIVAHRSAGENNRIYLRIQDSSNEHDFSCGFGDKANAISSNNNVVGDGKWHHGAITWGAGVATCYLDGFSIGSYSYNLPDVRGEINTGQTDNNYYFKGDIDDVRMYNYALSIEEIREIANESSDSGDNFLDAGLIVNYSMGLVVNNFLQDSSGNGNHVELKGAKVTSYNNDFVLEFDGNDYVEISGRASDIGLKKKGTAAMWFKANQLSDSGYLLNHWSPDKNNRIYMHIKGTENDFYCGFGDEKDAIASDNNVENDGKWHHAIITWDENLATCYLDGFSIGSYNYNLPDVNGILRLGKSENGFYYRGFLDDVVLYNYTFSLQEVSDFFSRACYSSQVADCGDECVSFEDVALVISSWKSGSTTINNILEVVGLWKRGC